MRSWDDLRNDDKLPDGELKELAVRQGRTYSHGHQKMYTAAIELISRVPAKILDIGCGIGFGAEQMVKHNCIKTYAGIDPDERAIEYCRELLPDLDFCCCEWPTSESPRWPVVDFVFCIEVIEHVDKKIRCAFLDAIRPICSKALFLSTPNPNSQPHGRVTPGQMTQMLFNAGFERSVSIEWQWTTFFIAQ